MIEEYPDTIFYPGYETALVGIAHRPASPPLAVYSATEIIQILMDRDGMTLDEAAEYLEYNIVGMWVGPGTPIVVSSL